MKTLREQLIAELTRIYFNPQQKIPLAEEMADAAIALMEKHK